MVLSSPCSILICCLSGPDYCARKESGRVWILEWDKVGMGQGGRELFNVIGEGG